MALCVCEENWSHHIFHFDMLIVRDEGEEARRRQKICKPKPNNGHDPCTAIIQVYRFRRVKCLFDDQNTTRKNALLFCWTLSAFFFYSLHKSQMHLTIFHKTKQKSVSNLLNGQPALVYWTQLNNRRWIPSDNTFYYTYWTSIRQW